METKAAQALQFSAMMHASLNLEKTGPNESLKMFGGFKKQVLVSSKFQSARLPSTNNIRRRTASLVVACSQNNVPAWTLESRSFHASVDEKLILKIKSQEIEPYLSGRCIYLVGMMASGKTTVGKKLSEALSYSFHDSDDLVVKEVDGKSVATIFKNFGEPFFRKKETEVLQKLSMMHRHVISTGGSWDTPIHVDAASGGFIAPFLYPDLEWDFRLPLVRSINVSGHKYGLVYPGVGWVVWRSKDDLPDELVFHINYLGSDQPTFTLNFSKGSSQIIAQYYQLIRLGFEGYKDIMANCWANARVLKEGIERIGRFNIISKDIGVPLVAFTLKDSSQHKVFEIADQLRKYGWIVPAYTMPPDAQHIEVLRVVIREDLNRNLAERLASDIEKVVLLLDTLPSPITTKAAIVTPITNENVNKSAIETQREIALYWKRLVDGRRLGAC